MNAALEKEYLHTFHTDGELFGLRLGRPTLKDAQQMVDIYIDVYGYEYLYPWVYDETLFKKNLADNNQWWIVVEPIATKVILGGGVLKKINDHTMFAAKLVCKNEYQGKGFAGVLGTIGVRSLYQRDVFESVLRLETDIRAKTYNSQRFIERIGCTPYGYIANYNNYADKRNFDPSHGKPFIDGRLEPVVMYFKPFHKFWKKRIKKVFLYDQEHIKSSYNIMKRFNRRAMKTDELIIKPETNKKCEDNHSFNISEDFYKGIVDITGYTQDIEYIKQKYSEWNIIEWRVPTDTEESIRYQKIAINHGFHIAGYDPCSVHHGTFADSILFIYYPNGINFSQFEDMSLTRKSKPFIELVMEQLSFE
jgi:RimJ/RimL family protein N-acetyltransferase